MKISTKSLCRKPWKLWCNPVSSDLGASALVERAQKALSSRASSFGSKCFEQLLTFLLQSRLNFAPNINPKISSITICSPAKYDSYQKTPDQVRGVCNQLVNVEPENIYIGLHDSFHQIHKAMQKAPKPSTDVGQHLQCFQEPLFYTHQSVC